MVRFPLLFRRYGRIIGTMKMVFTKSVLKNKIYPISFYEIWLSSQENVEYAAIQFTENEIPHFLFGCFIKTSIRADVSFRPHIIVLEVYNKFMKSQKKTILQ